MIGLIVYSLQEQPTWGTLRDALEFYASSSRRTYVRDRGSKAREVFTGNHRTLIW